MKSADWYMRLNQPRFSPVDVEKLAGIFDRQRRVGTQVAAWTPTSRPFNNHSPAFACRRCCIAAACRFPAVMSAGSLARYSWRSGFTRGMLRALSILTVWVSRLPCRVRVVSSRGSGPAHRDSKGCVHVERSRFACVKHVQLVNSNRYFGRILILRHRSSVL